MGNHETIWGMDFSFIVAIIYPDSCINVSFFLVKNWFVNVSPLILKFGYSKRAKYFFSFPGDRRDFSKITDEYLKCNNSIVVETWISVKKLFN